MDIRREPVTSDELGRFDDWVGLSRVTSGRHSRLFLLGLYVQSMRYQSINPAWVIRELRSMEGQIPTTGTKPATPFQRGVLSGLWHQHYAEVTMPSLIRNIQNSWHAQGMPFFEEGIRKAASGEGPTHFTAADAPAIANDMVCGAMARRRAAGALTGEWIVYAVHEGRNHYLSLWRHDGDDMQLRQSIEAMCVPFFPFLRDLLTPLPGAPYLAPERGP